LNDDFTTSGVRVAEKTAIEESREIFVKKMWIGFFLYIHLTTLGSALSLGMVHWGLFEMQRGVLEGFFIAMTRAGGVVMLLCGLSLMERGGYCRRGCNS
jgi:hypothetical protein